MSHLDNVLVNVLGANDANTEPKMEEMEQDEFHMKNYIPQRFHPYYQKYIFIAVGITVVMVSTALIVVLFSNSNTFLFDYVVLSIVLFIVYEFCLDNETGSNGTLTNIHSKLFFLINNTKILKFDPKTKNSSLIYESVKPVVSFDMFADQRLYWIEMIDNTSAQLKTLINNTFRNLVVVNIRTGNYTLLMSELNRPHEIVIDSEDAYMFILQSSSSVSNSAFAESFFMTQSFDTRHKVVQILRARMDGTEVSTLVSNIQATSLTLDPKRKRLYWINDYVKIESSDYEGRNRQSFFSDVVTITDLAILDGKLYWFWPGYNHPANLLSCKIGSNDSCEECTIYSMTILGDPMYMKGHLFNQGMSAKNPCEIDNGGCQHLCLLNSRNKRNCACQMGWQINPDKRSCRELHDFVLYTQDGFVRVNSIDGSTKDLIWPTPYKNVTITEKGEIDFDYDLMNDHFYWSDDYGIYKMKLKAYRGQATILTVNTSEILLQNIAYDWYTGNMYFVQRSKTLSRDTSSFRSLMIFNVNLGENHQKTLLTYQPDSYHNHNAFVSAIVLHPAKHSMFFASVHNKKRFIRHVDMAGTRVHEIFENFPYYGVRYHIIAIDYITDRVYWIWKGDWATVIKHAKFDGTDIKVISFDGINDAKTIYVHQQWLYVSNLTSIWRVHKEREGDVKRIAPQIDDDKKRIAGVRVISESVQFRDKENACAKDNGGCAQFCLTTANRVYCDCQDNLKAHGFQCS
ncbi:low-density lipoprotein receptor-related protein 1B-like [Phymastichus coffea]|uniref:low-density lipoprotein receptor-related protein 1B-like n=1 Tax=Phymastichus coffea TaxID=108790 RepID=UPI00273B5B1C|nr:low-density lipoprotein receptor-related protein 1B-like [Phymastichus coffea]